MRISLIAAVDRAWAIGVDNRLPWHLPDDLRRFKALTLGKPLLMGRLTAESLGRALPGRLNLVLTRGGRVPFDGMQAAKTPPPPITASSSARAARACLRPRRLRPRVTVGPVDAIGMGCACPAGEARGRAMQPRAARPCNQQGASPRRTA